MKIKDKDSSSPLRRRRPLIPGLHFLPMQDGGRAAGWSAVLLRIEEFSLTVEMQAKFLVLFSIELLLYTYYTYTYLGTISTAFRVMCTDSEGKYRKCG